MVFVKVCLHGRFQPGMKFQPRGRTRLFFHVNIINNYEEIQPSTSFQPLYGKPLVTTNMLTVGDFSH